MTHDDQAGDAADESLWQLTLGGFRDAAASDAPTPGGGSVAMVSAAMGLSLVLMALRISAKPKPSQPPDGSETARFLPLIESGDQLLAALSDHADADVAVFEDFMAALRMAKETEEDKTRRRGALDAARIAATEVPLNAAQTALEALQLSHQAAHLCQPGILSDVAAGAALLRGALDAVLYNVDVNIKGIKDTVLADDYARSRRHLAETGQQRADVVAGICHQRLS